METGKFGNQFAGKRHVVLPVIHTLDDKQAVANAKMISLLDGDGVFLINQGTSVQGVLRATKAVKEALPNLWVGVNLLGVHQTDVIDILAMPQHAHIGGFWDDNAGLITYRHQDGRPRAADDVYDLDFPKSVYDYLGETENQIGRKLLYFGGVEHKGCPQSRTPERSGDLARPFMDAITTTGPGTGRAADVSRVKAVWDGAQGHPVAIASGVTPENANDYLPYVNAILVASGISSGDYHNFDPNKVEKLMQAVRAWKAE